MRKRRESSAAKSCDRPRTRPRVVIDLTQSPPREYLSPPPPILPGSHLSTIPPQNADFDGSEANFIAKIDHDPAPSTTTTTTITTIKNEEAHQSTSSNPQVDQQSENKEKIDDSKLDTKTEAKHKENEPANTGKRLFHAVRPPGPSELGENQREAMSISIDMAEHSFNIKIKELIKIGDGVLVHGSDCCHGDTADPTTSVFKCSDCGMVAETVPHEWSGKDTPESKKSHIDALIQTFLAKPCDPNFT